MEAKIQEIRNQIEEYEHEFEYYGLRFHRGQDVPELGDELECSYVWVDEEITEEELPGTCALDIRTGCIDKIMELARSYRYGDGEFILIAGDYAMTGQDEGELVIENAVRIF